MFCSIYKWNISKALDSEMPFSNRLKHHLEHCKTCREFVDFSESLQKKAVAAKPDLGQGYPTTLPHRIMSSLDTSQKPKSKPGRTRYLIPITTSAALILTISTSVYFLTSPRVATLESLDAMLPLNQAQASLGETLNKLDSPLETEYQSLKYVVESTTEFLISRFDIKLGQEQE